MPGVSTKQMLESTSPGNGNLNTDISSVLDPKPPLDRPSIPAACSTNLGPRCQNDSRTMKRRKSYRTLPRGNWADQPGMEYVCTLVKTEEVVRMDVRDDNILVRPISIFYLRIKPIDHCSFADSLKPLESGVVAS